MCKSAYDKSQEHFPPLPPSTLPLWTGVIVGPSFWALQLILTYAAAHRMCAADARPFMYTWTALLFVGCMACGCLSYRPLHAIGARRDIIALRIRFLSSLGILLALLSALVIAAQSIATVMLDPCST